MLKVKNPNCKSIFAGLSYVDKFNFPTATKKNVAN